MIRCDVFRSIFTKDRRYVRKVPFRGTVAGGRGMGWEDWEAAGGAGAKAVSGMMWIFAAWKIVIRKICCKKVVAGDLYYINEKKSFFARLARRVSTKKG